MPQDKSSLIELEIQGRGVVGLSINSTGVLSCFSRGNLEPLGPLISTSSPQITLLINTPIYVRFTYSRSDVTSITSSCVIETSEGNISGALIPAPTQPAGQLLPDFLFRVTLTAFDDIFAYRVDQLHVFKGTVSLRNSSQRPQFGDSDPNLNPCKLEVKGLGYQYCLICSTTNGVSSYIDTEGGISTWVCDTSSTPVHLISAPESDFSQPSTRYACGLSMYYDKIYTIFGECYSCTNILCATCQLSDPNTCTSHLPSFLDFIPKDDSNTCQETSELWLNPMLHTCVDYRSVVCEIPNCSPAAVCATNRFCSKCETGFTWSLGACQPDIAPNPPTYIDYSSSIPKIEPCDSSCLECTNQSKFGCTACSLSDHLNPIYGTCSIPGVCPDREVLDPFTGSCGPCDWKCEACYVKGNDKYCKKCYDNYGTVPDPSTSKMECGRPCHWSCQQCIPFPIESQQICTLCWANFYKEPTETFCRICEGTCNRCNDGISCTNCKLENSYNPAPSLSLCVPCATNCRRCVNDTECTLCYDGRYLKSGLGGDNRCHVCPAGCTKCNSALFCTQCSPNNYLHLDNLCRACNTSNSMFILDGTKCRSCGVPNCLTCPNASTCTTCKPGYSLNAAGNVCAPCGDPLLPGFFILGSPPSQSCVACPGCQACTNEITCTSCPQGFRMKTTESQCVQSQCAFECSKCFPDTPLQCTQCFDKTKCASVLGVCNTCPPLVFVPRLGDGIVETAELTFNLVQISSNNPLEYKIVFSKPDIVFLSPETHLTVTEAVLISIEGLTQITDYTVNKSWDTSSGTIKIYLSIPATVPSSRIKAEFSPQTLNAISISTDRGQRLSHYDSSIAFLGYTVLTNTQKQAISAAGNIVTASGYAASASSGAVVLSSLFGNSLSFLSKMIQIMEFTSYMQLYNIDYDPILGNILGFIARATEVNILDIPTGSMYDKLDHSLAGIYRGALTRNKVAPYILQNMSYLGILLMFLYSVNFVLILITARKFRWLESLRYTLFSALYIDYLGFLYRTLGHHPYRTSSDPASKFSFAVAIFTLICFQYEIMNMLKQASYLYKIEDTAKTPLEKAISGYIYDGINPEALEKSFFARNFNIFFLLRFQVILMIIFNAQWQQMFQTAGSLIIQITFTVIIIYHSVKSNMFKNKFLKVFRIIQEISMCLIILLICIFYFDNKRRNMSQSTKSVMVITFIVLVCFNVLLEIANGVVGFLELFGCFKKKPLSKDTIADGQEQKVSVQEEEEQVVRSKTAPLERNVEKVDRSEHHRKSQILPSEKISLAPSRIQSKVEFTSNKKSSKVVSSKKKFEKIANKKFEKQSSPYSISNRIQLAQTQILYNDNLDEILEDNPGLKKEKKGKKLSMAGLNLRFQRDRKNQETRNKAKLEKKVTIQENLSEYGALNNTENTPMNNTENSSKVFQVKQKTIGEEFEMSSEEEHKEMSSKKSQRRFSQSKLGVSDVVKDDDLISPGSQTGLLNKRVNIQRTLKPKMTKSHTQNLLNKANNPSEPKT